MKKEKQLLKIVYFDEGAATDFIYIFEGGKSEEHKENIISKILIQFIQKINSDL